jgi:hypothetical protein
MISNTAMISNVTIETQSNPHWLPSAYETMNTFGNILLSSRFPFVAYAVHLTSSWGIGSQAWGISVFSNNTQA